MPPYSAHVSTTRSSGASCAAASRFASDPTHPNWPAWASPLPPAALLGQSGTTAAGVNSRALLTAPRAPHGTTALIVWVVDPARVVGGGRSCGGGVWLHDGFAPFAASSQCQHSKKADGP